MAVGHCTAPVGVTWAWLALLPVALSAPSGLCHADERAGLLARAEVAAGEVVDPAARSLVLAEVAVARAPTDAPGAERALAAALGAVAVVDDPLTRSLARRGVALRVRGWQPDRAGQWLDQSLDEARALPYAAQKALVLREVARDLAALDAPRARVLVDEAAQASREVDAALLRVAALRDLAGVAGLVDEQLACDLLQESSRLLVGAVSLEQGLQLARADLAVAWAAQDAEIALSEAGRLTDPEVAADCYLRLCEALAPTDADAALQAVGRQQDPTVRAQSLATLAAHLPRGRADLAATFAQAALKMGAGLADEPLEALQATAALGLADTDPAEALRLVRALRDPDLQAATWSDLALRLAQTRPQEALALAQDIADWLERERCLATLLPLLGTEQRAEALRVADRLRNPRLRAEALLALARPPGG